MGKKDHRSINQETIYSTEDELRFIRGLGTGKHSDASLPGLGKTRLVFLQGYFGACQARADWGKLNKDVILDFLQEEIANEEGKVRH
jgi:hypothetical protein